MQKKNSKESKSKEKAMPVKTEKDSSVKCIFLHGKVTSENSDNARALYGNGNYGALLEDGRVQFSFLESLFLLEKKKISLYNGKNIAVPFGTFLRTAKREEKNFWTRYVVFKDMRSRGYIIKTALKFGADFRVYDRGVKPGEDHAKWVLFPIHESNHLTWHDFAAKNRVAHSTKKNLLIAIVDDENDITYYEIRWARP